jgi:hypothetical protein
MLKEDPPELGDMAHPVWTGLDRIIRRCLQKQPEQNFQSAKDLAFALEALSGTTSRTAGNVAITGSAGKPRWPAFVAAAAVLGLTLGAAIAWYLHPGAAPPTFPRPICQPRRTGLPLNGKQCRDVPPRIPARLAWFQLLLRSRLDGTKP